MTKKGLLGLFANPLLTGRSIYPYNPTQQIAGVVKLVDALDSKSSGPRDHVGSIPTSGTIKPNLSTHPMSPVLLPKGS